ncbi:MAG TPA: hypothetical protein DDY93_00755 [Dehalococcoidia bacterium]|nr:hypothetical protein [Dehalococcoidia bacterium]HBJ29883.1 hypothetical protein [Dehalococcoidia bacterium]
MLDRGGLCAEAVYVKFERRFMLSDIKLDAQGTELVMLNRVKSLAKCVAAVALLTTDSSSADSE